MKKLILTVFMAVATFAAANAQNWWAGGSLGVWNNSDADVTTWNITPEAGYNFNDSWAAGLGIGLSGAKDFFGFELAPFARYTVVKAGDFKAFIDGGFELGAADYDYFGIGLKPGFSYNITPKLYLLSHMGYFGYRNDGFGTAQGFGLDLSSYTVNFGLYYAF